MDQSSKCSTYVNFNNDALHDPGSGVRPSVMQMLRDAHKCCYASSHMSWAVSRVRPSKNLGQRQALTTRISCGCGRGTGAAVDTGLGAGPGAVPPGGHSVRGGAGAAERGGAGGGCLAGGPEVSPCPLCHRLLPSHHPAQGASCLQGVSDHLARTFACNNHLWLRFRLADGSSLGSTRLGQSARICVVWTAYYCCLLAGGLQVCLPAPAIVFVSELSCTRCAPSKQAFPCVLLAHQLGQIACGAFLILRSDNMLSR